MKNFLTRLSFLLFVCLPSMVMAQPDSTSAGVVDQAMVPARILAARHAYNENNMRGALTIYREVLDADPKNVSALYGIAQCHYNLKKYGLALDYLNRSIEARGSVSTDDLMFFGKCYHRTAELDKAIDYFQQYQGKVRQNTFEYEEAGLYIRQCQLAKRMMASPAPVKISNMGEVINTRFEEYAPSITSDGTLMVFTSRRSDTKGGHIDEDGDYKYYEDIFFSRFDAASNSWSDAEPLQGEVNTETHDAVLSIAPDGSGIFVYKNNGVNAGDIFFSRHNKADDTWYAAEKMERPINTSYFEGSVSMTADGKTLYFISERMEGYGLGDIYVSHRKGDGWSSPKNLGQRINTDMDEKFVFIHPNGKTLFFASMGHEGMGSYDIYKTELVNGEWAKPVNLGYPINTVNEESTFSLTQDNKTLLIAAEYSDSYGDRDIYIADVSDYALLTEGYDKSVYGQLLCTVTDDRGKSVRGVTVRVYEKGSQDLIQEVLTDKNGYARFNLHGGQSYRVEISLGEDKAEQEVKMELKEEGETVVRLPMVI